MIAEILLSISLFPSANTHQIQQEAYSNIHKLTQLQPIDIAITPEKDVISYFKRGNSYMKSGEYSKAVADFTKVININPQFSDAYSNRGLVYLALQQPELALTDLTKGITVRPEYAVSYLKRGMAYMQLQQPKNAIADFTAAIEVDPQFVDAYLFRGTTYQKIGKNKQARKSLEQAASLYKERGQIKKYQMVRQLLLKLEN